MKKVFIGLLIFIAFFVLTACSLINSEPEVEEIDYVSLESNIRESCMNGVAFITARYKDASNKYWTVSSMGAIINQSGNEYEVIAVYNSVIFDSATYIIETADGVEHAGVLVKSSESEKLAKISFSSDIDYHVF
ncbi:MAG: hypothetical protein CVV58_06275, partial [Tenericutes bacterium HGW-Tenericutes-3]